MKLLIPKLQRLCRWSLGMDKYFHPTHYWTCDYLSMLGLKLIHVSKGAPGLARTVIPYGSHFVVFSCGFVLMGKNDMNKLETDEKKTPKTKQNRGKLFCNLLHLISSICWALAHYWRHSLQKYAVTFKTTLLYSFAQTGPNTASWRHFCIYRHLIINPRLAQYILDTLMSVLTM